MCAKKKEKNIVLPEETQAFKNADQRIKEQIKESQFEDYKAPSSDARGKEINWAAGPSTDELQRVAGPNADKLGFTLENVDNSFHRYQVRQPEYQENISKIQLRLPNGASAENVAGLATRTEKPNNASTNTPVSEQKTKTWEEIMAGRRAEYKQDKTDAVKMQKYYALSDALKSLGQMGGTAIGSAIGGGKAIDNATPVAEYKPSRGYLDAFEKAKNANERLRKLDEVEFQFAYDKKQRDEERAYKAEQDRINREYNAAQAELNRNWQAEQQRINREWQKAVADQDFERQAALKKEILKLEQDYKSEYQRINNEHETAIKQISKDIVSIQNNTKVPIGFTNGTGITIPKAYYEDMQEFFIGRDWNGRKVTESNVKSYIKNNPEEAKAYLDMFGLGDVFKVESTPSTKKETETEQSQSNSSNQQFPMHITQVPVENMSSGTHSQTQGQEENIEDIFKELGVVVVN